MPAVQTMLARFRRDEDGTIAILFGLMVLMIFSCIGIAIDCARIYHASAKATAAVDTAVLAAARAMRVNAGISDAELQTMAQSYFDANVDKAGVGLTKFDPGIALAIDRPKGTIVGKVPVEVGTYFMRIGGPAFEKINFERSSTATYNLIDVEIGLMVDVTGSMGNMNKINDMKASVATLANIMLPAGGSPGKTRIGLAPFSGAVNLGPYAAIASNNRSTDGCVIERLSPGSRASDAAPAGNPFGVKGDLSTNSAYACPTAQLQPLTDSASQIIATVNTYTPGGCTGGHMGANWAWNLVSPAWSGVWPASSAPAPYGDGKTVKVAILMTDGLFNTAFVNGGSNCADGNPVSPTLAKDMCDAMKAKGMTVYTVGFRLSGAPAAKATLAACASGPKQFLEAENGAELTQAFTDIAIQLNNLRLAK